VELVVLLLALQQIALDARGILGHGAVSDSKDAADQESGRKLPEDSSPVRHVLHSQANMRRVYSRVPGASMRQWKPPRRGGNRLRNNELVHRSGA